MARLQALRTALSRGTSSPMNDEQNPRSGKLGRGAAAKLERQERQAKSLRDNLKRRKAQVRGRGTDVVEPPADTHVDSPESPDKES